MFSFNYVYQGRSGPICIGKKIPQLFSLWNHQALVFGDCSLCVANTLLCVCEFHLFLQSDLLVNISLLVCSANAILVGQRKSIKVQNWACNKGGRPAE